MILNDHWILLSSMLMGEVKTCIDVRIGVIVALMLGGGHYSRCADVVNLVRSFVLL